MEKELIYKRQKIYKYDKYGNKNIEYYKVFTQDDKPLLMTNIIAETKCKKSQNEM